MAISPDMSFWINRVIFNKLADICPTLSLNGEDRKVYEICIQDFRNYLVYVERNWIKIDETPNEEMAINIISTFGGAEREIFSVITGLEQNLKSTREVTEFVDCWVQMWWQKWQIRVKLIFKDEPNKFNVDSSILPNNFTVEEHRDLLQIMIDKLIQYGEICCTNVIAESLFKKEVQASQRTEWSMQDKIQFIPRLQRLAREICYTHGPLVFIKPNKGYGLREWRDDNANKIV